MTTTNAEAARVYLTDRRDRISDLITKITNELTVWEGRRMEINHLLEELDTPMGEYVPRDDTPKKAKPKPAEKPPGEITATEMTIYKLLVAAGEDGLDAKQVAKMMDIPIGSSSSCLSSLKARGMAEHKKPKYWAMGKKPIFKSENPSMLDGLNV